ncbi:MAG TPA: hypothetical protein VNT26_14575 [Candidatus Sulfotelmatobacter sp.]|nr:hypothetical protein [Candidatus Sulfotelmatobacter sp.]
MKTKTKLFASAAALLLPWCLATTSPAAEAETAKSKIGIYDSRAVVVAFSGSEAFQKWMTPIQAEYTKAKQAGDTERMKQIDQQMQAMQTLRHKQGFSTAPVDDILKHIETRLPAIQKEAGVEALVSKWDQATLAKYPTAQKVDVTMRLVDEFHPNARQRQSAIEIQKHKPISLSQAQDIKE